MQFNWVIQEGIPDSGLVFLGGHYQLSGRAERVISY
jgi:hypothetical protein